MTRKEYMSLGLEALNIIIHNGNRVNKLCGVGANLSVDTKSWLRQRKLYSYNSTSREAATLFGVDVMHDNPIPDVDPISQIKLKALRVKYGNT